MERNPWIDLDPTLVVHGTVERIGLLRNSTTAGRASVSLAIQLDDGRIVIADTTWRLFDSAARALAATPIVAEET